MMPTIVEKGYAPIIYNDIEWMDHIRGVLSEAKAVDAVVNDARVVEGTAVINVSIPGSDDAFLLIEGVH